MEPKDNEPGSGVILHYPFLKGSVGIKHKANGSLLIVREHEVQALADALTDLARRIKDENPAL